MSFNIALLAGDGIGPEVMFESVLLLKEIEKLYNCSFSFREGKVGGVAIEHYGTPLPEETVELCKRSDAILLGAVGGPAWDHLPVEIRPETGLLQLRKQLGLFANLRPVKVIPPLTKSSPLKDSVIMGVDLCIVRELTGGLYFGTPRERRIGLEGEEVIDTLVYKRYEIERIVREAFELARLRKRKLVSVDKANVLESSRLWREIADALSIEYSDVKLEHMYIDNAAMQLIKKPIEFDVIVTENMFGDILSDEASVLTGSIGMLPSASIGNGPSLYEPIHGSAPDIAGRNVANPLAAFLSVALMLRYSFGLSKEAECIEGAVHSILLEGYRTKDLADEGKTFVSTSEMGALVRDAIQNKYLDYELVNFYEKCR
ncbi:3-isopropylmalate dehydrogenase [Bacillus salitolerans]|uniref:3-isopropylmalate dehydrogenase n=1 Tax=Bacillus salitolerans TaxID=1437434 RepID=A0ABW4LTF1_9BACI